MHWRHTRLIRNHRKYCEHSPIHRNNNAQLSLSHTFTHIASLRKQNVLFDERQQRQTKHIHFDNSRATWIATFSTKDSYTAWDGLHILRMIQVIEMFESKPVRKMVRGCPTSDGIDLCICLCYYCETVSKIKLSWCPHPSRSINSSFWRI